MSPRTRTSGASAGGFRLQLLEGELLEVFLRLGPARGEGFERGRHGPGDDDVAVPLVVGGDYQPRRPRRAGRVDGVLVGLLVVVPMAALAHVVGRELVVLALEFQALAEALQLRILGDVEEE